MFSAYGQMSVYIGSQQSVTGCNINIYDDGGPVSPYGSWHNYTLTVNPGNNQGRVILEVLAFDIHQSDTLFIYDGDIASGTPMATLNNSTFSITGNNNTFMASQGNSSGALTLRFKTSVFLPFFGGHGDGFHIHASCAAPCTPFQIVLDTTNCSHIPTPNPEDSYHYIDLCPDEPVHLAVKGIYPNQENAGYTQNDATTTFTWMFGSESTVSGVGLTSQDHIFTAGEGMEVLVTASDSLQCPVSVPVSFRVRVSKNPVKAIQPLPKLCVGQSFTPAIGYNDEQDIELSEVGHTQHASLVVYDSVFLPDGIYCQPYGTYYRSSVTFSEFAPGATITNPNDILYVRIKMEHSAIEDLKIELFCPNGNSCTILPYPNFGTSYWGPSSHFFRVNLGKAYRPDGGTCSPTLNPMGEPWNYVWSNNITLGYQYADNVSCFNSSNFHSHYNPHWDDSNDSYFHDTQHSFSVDSSDVTNMTNIYQPHQNFNTLTGCPLNGNWYIQVQDMREFDNGYIVEWELALADELLPSIWEYTIGMDTFYFSGNQVIDGNTLLPQDVGVQPYTLNIVDEFGCQYDTTLHLTVLDIPEVSLGDDRMICNGESVTLSPESPNDSYNYLWSTGQTAPTLTVSTPGAYALTASITHDNSVLCQSSDTVEVIVGDAITTIITDSICAGHPYDRNGFSISTSDIGDQTAYTTSRTLTSQSGCDSVVTLDLTIRSAYHTTIEETACNEYTWEGETYTESGEYHRPFTSADGCDSILTLVLSIGHPSESELWETSCGPYRWGNETLSESGDYTREFQSSHECDSLVTLHLTVLDTTLATSNSNPDFCNTGETVLSVEGNFDTYVWNTGEVAPTLIVNRSGHYSVTASNEACERTAHFEVPPCIPNLLLPNAITPSRNDGHNDVLTLSEYDRSQISEFSIAIYDRWGGLAFWSNDKNFHWDGTKDGKLEVGAVFNYLIQYTDHNGKHYRITGSVTVL